MNRITSAVAAVLLLSSVACQHAPAPVAPRPEPKTEVECLQRAKADAQTCREKAKRGSFWTGQLQGGAAASAQRSEGYSQCDATFDADARLCVARFKVQP